jgi:hypothetical protein
MEPNMASNRNSKRAKKNDGETSSTAPHAHLIRIPDTEARRRAIEVLGEVQRPYCGFTDYQLLITNEHLEVLKREEIPFEVVS